MSKKIMKYSLNGKMWLIFFFLISNVFVLAQSFRDVSGVIKDVAGEPVIGVNVTVRGDKPNRDSLRY